MTENTAPEENNQEIDEDTMKIVEEANKLANEPEEAAPDSESIINDLNDKILRAAAEMQNIRRRSEIDVQKARQFSIESFAKDLLGVFDNLGRTLDNISVEDAAKDEKLGNLRAGVELTKNELTKVFERNGVKSINPVGEKFNHNLHQAISQVEDAEKESGTVLDVMQTGYVINDRVLRPAMVVVIK